MIKAILALGALAVAATVVTFGFMTFRRSSRPARAKARRS
ncbi:MAG: hypothetical protein K0R62_2990 [Nonomuraea muscovyensis]|nr:hypothetical protein [Nonomuraea muscovyensis]